MFKNGPADDIFPEGVLMLGYIFKARRGSKSNRVEGLRLLLAHRGVKSNREGGQTRKIAACRR